ncbi:MAG: prepilin-type N-terminal cleavage/methylation domain-containing protein [Planctomycetota bacterium]
MVGAFESSNTRRRAFTLLELLVVLTLVALIAAIAAPRLAGTFSQSRMETAIAQVVTFDRQVRSIALKQNRDTTLNFDLASDRLTASWERAEMEVSAKLPTSVHIESVVSRRDRQRSRGRAEIRAYGDGTTDGYAVQLVIGQRRQWLFFAGLTGQVTRLESTRETEAILDAIR